MNDTQYERLAAIVTKGTTIAQLKEIVTRNKFEVISTNTSNYAPLKSDYVDATMGLLTGYNPFRRCFVWHADYLFNLRAFPEAIQEALIQEVV